jgi:hypothetical protein
VPITQELAAALESYALRHSSIVSRLAMSEAWKTAGYNFVRNRWLVGVQSEVSYNLTRVFLQGSSSFTSSGSQISQTFLSTGQVVFPLTTTNSNSIQTQAISQELRHNWTVSEMGKIGFLATPDLLAYGLLGWSWGGFDVDNFLPYTLDGFTYGGGFERDFGWLRGFIQVKAIDYRGKSLIIGNGFNSTSTSASVAGAPGSNFSTNNSGGTTNSRLSTQVTSVTAGITIPLIFPR